MGIYADNVYNLTVPVESIQDILAAWPAKPWQGEYKATPEGIVTLIADEFGSEGDLPEYEVEGETIHIRGWTSGKIGEPDALSDILAANGVTGIVSGEMEGGLFLVEFTDGQFKVHNGQVVFPTYKGNLYE